MHANVKLSEPAPAPEKNDPIELIEVAAEPKSGDALLVLPDEPLSEASARQLLSSLEPLPRSYVAAMRLQEEGTLGEVADRLLAALNQKGIKRITLFGVGRGGQLAQTIAARDAKLIRRVVLVDTTARKKRTPYERLFLFISQLLPQGLPGRSDIEEFDASAFLHRVRCPALVLVSPDAIGFVRRQGSFLATRLPNAWLTTLGNRWRTPAGSFSPELCSLLQDFSQKPTKKPQKNEGAEAAA